MRSQVRTTPAELLLTGCHLIDGVSDDPLRNHFVEIREGKVVSTGPMAKAPRVKGLHEIDCQGRTVMPGLTDCHVHLVYAGSKNMEEAIRFPVETAVIHGVMHARAVLNAGFTAVREVGTLGNTSVALRDAIRQRKIYGPKILASGRGIGGTGSGNDLLPAHWESHGGRLVVDGIDAIRKAVRRQVREGVDNIKFIASGVEVHPTAFTWMTTFSEDELRAGIEEAKRWGRSVAVHAQSYDSVKFALRWGADTIEHGTRLDEESIELFRKSNAFLVPTLCTLYSVLHLGEKLGLSQKQRDEMKVNESFWEKSIKDAYKAGVQIASGGDLGNRYPHGDNAKELEYLVGLGIRPMDALRSATSVAARAMRRADRFGSIKPGMEADVIVVNGDPLKDITCLQELANINMVFQDGEMVAGSEWKQPADETDLIRPPKLQAAGGHSH
jgi:imidazolonepropionase-like amidohydrolase